MPPDQKSGSGLAMLAALAGHSGGSSNGSGIGSALGGGLGGVAGDLLGVKSSGALFVDMLQGPTVEDQLIATFDLRKLYGLKYWEDARKELAARTTIKEDRKSGVITIAVSDRDPRRAQQMAQDYVDALNGLVAKVSTSSARRERIFLEDRLKSVKQTLDNASQEFSDFASKSGTLNVPDQTKAMVDSEASLQGQLVAAESELEGLREIYTDSNVRVKTLQARVASLKRQVEQMSGNGADHGAGKERRAVIAGPPPQDQQPAGDLQVARQVLEPRSRAELDEHLHPQRRGVIGELGAADEDKADRQRDAKRELDKVDPSHLAAASRPRRTARPPSGTRKRRTSARSIPPSPRR